MQLWYAPTSPFARKVRIAGHELGLISQIELIEVNPWIEGSLRELNPLSKVPTLLLRNGDVLMESSVICDYLDSIQGKPQLHPLGGESRWQALLLQGLADGASSAAGRLYAEEKKPETQRSTPMMTRFRLAVGTCLDVLETKRAIGTGLTIGHISMAAFVGYLDFRWPDQNWRTGRPNLASWFDEFSRRESMMSTQHRPITA